MKIIDDNVIDITEETKKNHDKRFKILKEKRETKRKRVYHDTMIVLLMINQLVIYFILFYLLTK